MDINPFPDLNISDTSVLDKADTKVLCPSCGRRRRYFCYSCVLYVNGLEKIMPVVKVSSLSKSKSAGHHHVFYIRIYQLE